MSKRQNQLNSTIQRAVQGVIDRGLNDPRIRGLITVTGVDIQSDFKAAKISVSVLPETRESSTMHGLRAGARHIRHQIADSINLPRTPELTFELDRSLKNSANVIEIINRELGEYEPPEAAEDNESTPSEGPHA